MCIWRFTEWSLEWSDTQFLEKQEQEPSLFDQSINTSSSHVTIHDNCSDTRGANTGACTYSRSEFKPDQRSLLTESRLQRHKHEWKHSGGLCPLTCCSSSAHWFRTVLYGTNIFYVLEVFPSIMFNDVSKLNVLQKTNKQKLQTGNSTLATSWTEQSQLWKFSFLVLNRLQIPPQNCRSDLWPFRLKDDIWSGLFNVCVCVWKLMCSYQGERGWSLRG